MVTYITKENLNSVINNSAITEKWYQPLVVAMNQGAINTKNRVSAFVSQILHESGNLRLLEENLNYTAEQLMRTWPTRFKTLEFAKQYERQPAKIANYVYGGRMGNNTTGDGYKYRGRGVIQLTGKDNYAAFQKATGVPVLDNPDLLKQPEYALRSAVWFWNKNNLSPLADKGDFKTITQRINGGQHGASDRESKYSKLLNLAKEVALDGVEFVKKKPRLVIGTVLAVSAIAIGGYILYSKLKKQ